MPEPTGAMFSQPLVDRSFTEVAPKGGDRALSLVLDRLTGGTVERPD